MKKELENILKTIIENSFSNNETKNSLYIYGEKYFEEKEKFYLSEGFTKKESNDFALVDVTKCMNEIKTDFFIKSN